MIFKVLYTVVVLIICIVIYYNIKEKDHSLGFIIVTGVITTIIGNFLLPSNIFLFDNYFEQIEEVSDTNESGGSEIPFANEEEVPVSVEPSNVPESTEEQLQELSDGELGIAPINITNKSIDNIEDNLLEIDPVELHYYEGNIVAEEQIDTYQFVPPVNGRYRFEATDMLSGVKINIVVLNQAGDREKYSSYGIENGDGLTIDDMIAGETYTVQIKQYSSYSSYRILIGLQKNTVNIDSGVTQITDSIQYTDQKNIYQFIPPLTGRYRFELDEMTSGTEVNMSIYNPGGEREDYTSYGISNGDGLTIDNMISGETYSIVITQYTSNMNYKLLIGYQKETVQIDGETEISDSIQYTAQLNQYQFVPPINGRYRFEISDITSGAEVNMKILNQAGGNVDYTSYGISKNEGLTIDNMVAGEIYTIQITQYNSYSPYQLEIGYQKEPIEINVSSVSDTMQYTQQQNVYQFSPQSNSNYSFIIENMISGMKVNISVYNEGGVCVAGTSYGIDNGDGVTIENMVKGEIYTIYITQYEGEGTYLLTIN